MRIVAFMLIAGVFAGCLGGPSTGPDIEPTERTMPSGQTARDYIESYVMTHPFRSNNAAHAEFMGAARSDLRDLLLEMGLHVEMQEVDQYVNVLAFNNGSDPSKWVVLSAHYDTVAAGVGTTVYGAWDDGAGVAALLELAATVGSWDLPFTVVFAFFDGEESGLQGSQRFVDAYFADGQTDLVANINMDPPGLNWPCGDETGAFPVKIIHEQAKIDEGRARYVWLYDAIEHGLAQAEVPNETRDYTPGIPIATAGGFGVTGTSDHANFAEVDVANVFLGGTPTTQAGPGAALTYPLHTPLDTLQAMEARCTQGTLAEGLHTIVTTVAHAIDHMSQGVPQ